MDDPFKTALDQARNLALGGDVARATDALRDFSQGPGLSATQQLMADLERQEKWRTLATGGLDTFTERLTQSYALDQEKLRSIQGVIGSLATDQDDFQRRLSAVSDLLEPWNRRGLATEEFSRLAVEAATAPDRFGAIMGPAYELSTATALANHIPDLQSVSALSEMLRTYESQFILPEMDLVQRLATEATTAQRFFKDLDLASTAARMHHPWLDPDIASQSFKAFADLQGVSQFATGRHPFSDEVSGYLRDRLGDWRRPIAWADTGLDDIAVRAAFYADQGFDTELTEMPPPAFEESIEIGGLVAVRFDLVAAYGEPVPLADAATEAIFARSNRAHKWLTRFEHAFRRYVHAKMASHFGENWPKQKLPKELRLKWVDKRDKAVRHEEEGLLIEYADLPDFEQFIFASDVWPLFQPKLQNIDSSREALRRLYPLRNPVMHARPISLRDELILFADLQRLTSLFMDS